jgi:hypothetical protein
MDAAKTHVLQVILFGDNLRDRLRVVTENIDKIAVASTDAEAAAAAAAIREAREQLTAAADLVDLIMGAAKTSVYEIENWQHH